MQSLPYDTIERTFAPGQQRHEHLSLIPPTALSTNKAVSFESIHQADNTVVAQIESLSEAPNGGPSPILEGTHGQKQLILLRFEADSACGLVATIEKLADAIT